MEPAGLILDSFKMYGSRIADSKRKLTRESTPDNVKQVTI